MPLTPEEDRRNDPRRKRLLFRCQHRGMKEVDLMLGGFVERNLTSLGDADIAAIEALLDESDNDLMNWFLGREPVPEDRRSPVLDRLVDENSGS